MQHESWSVELSAPALVVFSGLPGTGKSTLARPVAALLPAELIETDRVRRELLARRDYSVAERAAVYAACHERIAEALAAGRAVVFDATNLTGAHRRPLYRLAAEHGARLTIVQTVLDREAARLRLDRRAAGGDPGQQSEALWPAYEALAAQVEPIERPHLVIDTAGDLTAAVEWVVRAAREAQPSSEHQTPV